METIKLSTGEIALIDDDDYRAIRVHKWNYAGSNGRFYAATNISGKKVYMHRMVMEMKVSRKLRTGEEVDHIDGNPLNNQSENLRIVGRVENQRNQRHHSDSKSPYIGVYYNPRYKLPYQVKITIDYKNIHLGRFDTADKAAEHRDKAVLKLFGRYVQLNFPEKYDEYLTEIKSGFDPYPPKRKYSSKHPGISYQAGIKKWKATAYIKGDQIHIGVYDTEDEAVVARSEYLKANGMEDKNRVKR